jgi:hypothetical protein
MLRRGFTVCMLTLATLGSVWAGSFDDFFVAIKRDDASALMSLDLRGFDLNTVDAKGRSGLHVALVEGYIRAADYLARSPVVNVDARNAQNETPLMLAVLKGHEAIARVLIGRDADVNKPGWAPLHYAASFPGPTAVALVQLLLEHSAYIDAESPNGTTPLMMAARYGAPEVVKLLLTEGADVTVRNQQGLRAVDFAVLGGRPTAIELLTEATRAALPDVPGHTPPMSAGGNAVMPAASPATSVGGAPMDEVTTSPVRAPGAAWGEQPLGSAPATTQVPGPTVKPAEPVKPAPAIAPGKW